MCFELSDFYVAVYGGPVGGRLLSIPGDTRKSRLGIVGVRASCSSAHYVAHAQVLWSETCICICVTVVQHLPSVHLLPLGSK